MRARNIVVITLMLPLLILTARSPQMSHAANYDGDGDSVATTDVAAFDFSHNLVADLSISKSDSPDPVVVGQLLTYTLNITNNGPSDATGVILTDTLPATVNFVSATPASCSELGGVVTCNLGNVANASSTVATIRVTPTTAGPITNTAEVTGNEPDPNMSNNTATQTTTVVAPSADLRVTKTDSPDPIVVGATLTYIINVRNDGPSLATAVTLTDTLPPGVTLVSAIAQGPCNELSGTVTCNLGDIGVGVTASSTLIRIIPNSTGVITNTASVEADSPPDPDTSNNTATQTTTVVVPSADLRVTKTDSPDPVVVGEILTYRIDVFNNGPSSSTAVTLTDTLPPGVTFISATSPGGCNELGGIVTCNIGDLDLGAMTTSTVIRIIPTSTGLITNTATVVASSPPDPNLSNNTATQTTTVVVPSADISVTKTDFPDPVFVGDILTYRINIRNNGPSVATGVTLIDTLPPGVTFVSAIAQGPCNELGGTVTCDIGDLGIGLFATTTLIRIIPNEGGLITNTVSVQVDSPPDFNPGNNTATQSTSVITPAADLSITKADFPDPVLVGETLTYTVDVRNNGPSVATGVILTDVLPPGVTFVSVASQGPCNKIAGTITCDIGNLGVGVMASSTVIKIIPNASGLITNTASVTVSDPLDPNPDNNTATQTTAVSPADLSLSKGDDPDPVLAGQPLVYTLKVVNIGPATSTAVILIDTLPEDVDFVSATPTQGSCNEVAGSVTCNLGNLAVGSVATTTIVVIPTAAGTIINAANVAGPEFDPDVTNNSASITTSVTAPADLLPVAIDIKPGSDPNSVNPKSRGTIPVAILSTPDFDAPSEVDKASLTFGRTGDEDSLARCTRSSEDVNGDGLLDIVCHFKTQDTGFQPGDTEGILRGETLDGVSIEGRDSIRLG